MIYGECAVQRAQIFLIYIMYMLIDKNRVYFIITYNVWLTWILSIIMFERHVFERNVTYVFSVVIIIDKHKMYASLFLHLSSVVQLNVIIYSEL